MIFNRNMLTHAKRICIILNAFVFGAAISTIRASYVISIETKTRQYVVFLAAGSFGIGTMQLNGPPKQRFSCDVRGPENWQWLPLKKSYSQGNAIDLSVPLWTILAVLAIVEIVFWRFDGVPPGYCQFCGYDLRASQDRCPECGNERTCAKDEIE